MYNAEKGIYTLANQAKSYNWLVTSFTPADYAQASDSDLYALVDLFIRNAIQNDRYELEKGIASGLAFPIPHYATAQVFEDAESYRTFKIKTMHEDYAAEREAVFQFLKQWIAENIEDPTPTGNELRELDNDIDNL